MSLFCSFSPPTQPRRMSFGSFGTLRRKRQEDSEEYLCPMDVEMPQSSSFHRGLRVYEDELDQLEQARPMSQKKHSAIRY